MSELESKLLETQTIGDNILVVLFKAPQINDMDFLEELEDSLRDLLTEFEQRFLLIDFCEVSLISSRMINSLLQLAKRVRAEGGQVHLCGLETKIERVLKSMKLDRVFDIYETPKEGLVAMKQVLKSYLLANVAQTVSVIVDVSVDRDLLAEFLAELASVYRELSNGDELVIRQGKIPVFEAATA